MRSYELQVIKWKGRNLRLLIKYSSNPEVSSKKVNEYDPSKAYRERYVKDRMDGHGKDESEEKSFCVWQNPGRCIVCYECPGEIESDDDTADDMCHERKNRSKYPCRKDTRTQKSWLFRDIFQIENVFYEPESESDENRKEHSFFDGIHTRERACDHAKMFAGFLNQCYDDIIKEYQFECPENHSTHSHAPICNRCFQYAEREEKSMKNRKKHSESHKYARIHKKSFPYFSDVLREYPERKQKHTERDSSYCHQNGSREPKEIIPLSQEWEYVPRLETNKCEDILHEKYGNHGQGSCKYTNPESPSSKRGIVEVWKYISPDKYGEKRDYDYGDERQYCHSLKRGLLLIWILDNLFFPKNLIFPELYTFTFPVFENHRKQEHIRSDDDEKYPDNVGYEVRRRDHKDSEKYKNHTDKIHKRVF